MIGGDFIRSTDRHNNLLEFGDIRYQEGHLATAQGVDEAVARGGEKEKQTLRMQTVP